MNREAENAPPLRPPCGERGSALLVALMLMAVLSLTSILFLALGDTEVRHSQLNLARTQPLYAAEGVVQVAQNWFDDPNPNTNALMPAPEDFERDQRRCDLDRDGAFDAACDGSRGAVYRGGRVAGERRLFERPYRGDPSQTFLGTREHPDLLMREDTRGGYLLRLNHLFNPRYSKSLQGLQIREIRVYAPPTDADTGLRRGIATLEVTVEKRRHGNRLGRRRVQAVLAEIPWPRTRGPVESAGTVVLDRGAAAHWGVVSAEGDLELGRREGPFFPDSSLPRRSVLSSDMEDVSPHAPDRTRDTEQPATWGVQNLLTELLGLSEEGLMVDRHPLTPRPVGLEDPWLRLGARGTVKEGRTTHEEDQPWPWSWKPGDMPNLRRAEDDSHVLGGQPVAAADLDYGLWKAVADTSHRATHLLRYAGLDEGGEPVFRRGGRGVSRTFAAWTNSLEGAGAPGIFFFDTANGRHPDDGGVPTPPVHLDPPRVEAGHYLAQGLILLHGEALRASRLGGGRGAKVRLPRPGEPFLDTGLDLDGDGVVGNTAVERSLIGNGRWDCDCDRDGDVDEDDALAAFTSHDVLPPSGLPDRLEDPRLRHNDLDHQPHEPFLNLHTAGLNPANGPSEVDFSAAGQWVEDADGDGTPSPGDIRTTRGRDEAGALAERTVHLNGLLFSTGRFESTGGFSATGALVFRGDFEARGRQDFWFDERLRRGAWPPAEMKLPRVVVTSLVDSPR